MLGVSFQAVSKWENGNSMPDILLLPKLAAVLNVSCDILIGHYPQFFLLPMMNFISLRNIIGGHSRQRSA